MTSSSKAAKAKSSSDFHLILATTVVLGLISAICVWGMFYFKLARIHEMAPVVKAAWMNRMNGIVAPLIIALILLLGICVPKRLLPTVWLNRFSILLIVTALVTSWFAGVKTGLLVVLAAALILQTVVLFMAIGGSSYLNFEKKGYWVRIGSSLIHLGLILFVLDLFFHRQQTLHLLLFWITTGATVLGMIFCFYAESVVKLISAKKDKPAEVQP
ncbi:MAG: hypothetical protein KKG47_16745 [Proteobacteria bacterium]|nr:hypothetical protein [Pseudomonadota bacterium]MBU1738651.1 hypothetical protein [Pseudomonadota bacterium]